MTHSDPMDTKKIFNIVAAFIYEQNRFLICQRPKTKARALLWEFAGGKVEQGESHIQALKRECMEELAIEVEPSGLFYQNSHDTKISLSIFSSITQK